MFEKKKKKKKKKMDNNKKKWAPANWLQISFLPFLLFYNSNMQVFLSFFLFLYIQLTNTKVFPNTDPVKRKHRDFHNFTLATHFLVYEGAWLPINQSKAVHAYI